MLVTLSRGEVLLVKRPSPGIWGGLWSLPEIAESEVPRAAKPLAPFEHAFTHFTLEVTPWLIEGTRAAPLAAEDATLWLPLSELAGAALPAPVRTLLRSVSAGAGSGAGPRRAASRR
jgi:A/G-specific adenine glycosylase